MSQTSFYKKYDKEIWGLGLIILIGVAGYMCGLRDGYVNGINSVPSPEYKIQTCSIEMNYTQYNETYYQLTKGDAEGNWVIDIEPRDDYFMIGISIIAQSANWTRFWVWIDAYGIMLLGNTTLELVHIVTQYQSGGTHEINWYNTQIGGMTCNERADIIFLGYGDWFEGLDTAISGAVRIRGLFN